MTLLDSIWVLVGAVAVAVALSLLPEDVVSVVVILLFLAKPWLVTEAHDEDALSPLRADDARRKP